MLSRLVKHSVSSFPRSASTISTSKTLANHYKKLTIFGGFTSLALFDYFVRDAESIGAVIRFGRSLKIAADISFDYNFGLKGLDENSDEYDKVGSLISRKS